ncbi:hypothetical protein HN937_04130 [Candidatus Poribacteria bacterium]|nr:hypothetical protein [Candidatus Poribacteria bacterium]
MPDLPDPDFSAAPTPAPEPVPAPVDSSSATVEPATDAVDAAADADPPLDIDEMLPEDADPA